MRSSYVALSAMLAIPAAHSMVAAPARAAPRNPARRAWAWRQVAIDPSQPPGDVLPIGESLRQGASVVIVDDVASEEECRSLSALCSRAAAVERAQRDGAEQAVGLVRVHESHHEGLVRLPSVEAAARCRLRGTACAAPLPPAADAMATALLLRAMEFVDAELHSIVSCCFGAADSTLREMRAQGGLEYSHREPAVNVYSQGGEFLAHKDHQHLTVLLPLSSPDDDFAGGGTGFWAQDARGHRVEAPSVVLRPPAGSAMLFGGSATHAGLPVATGERVVLVASFSLRGGRRRAREACSRDVYGDSL